MELNNVMNTVMQLLNNFYSGKERSISVVPRLVIVVLLAGLLAQVTWHALRPPVTATATKLPGPPSKAVLQVVSMGEPVALSRLLMLWLQAFDNQPGISIPFKDLNYDRVIAWLDEILALDQRSRYPLLTASRVYAEVPDRERSRKMLEFVYRKFMLDPNNRWPWLAQAVFVAKHRLYDLDLAMKYARALRVYAIAAGVPAWARQMELFILEDMGDLEDARILLGGMIDSGVVKDPNELKFFTQRLDEESKKPGVKSEEKKATSH